jgi:hypothetical protein
MHLLYPSAEVLQAGLHMQASKRSDASFDYSAAPRELFGGDFAPILPEPPRQPWSQEPKQIETGVPHFTLSVSLPALDDDRFNAMPERQSLQPAILGPALQQTRGECDRGLHRELGRNGAAREHDLLEHREDILGLHPNGTRGEEIQAGSSLWVIDRIGRTENIKRRTDQRAHEIVETIAI